MATLKYGSRGDDVRSVQMLLNCEIDGIFGRITEEALKDFQRKNGLTADGIVGPKTWNALGLKAVPTRPIKEIIIHCAATPEGKDFTVDDIRGWHLQRGFADIGYHYVIYRDGSIHEGRDINVVGAHTTNHNTGTIGICYIGGVDAQGKPKDTRTEAQKKSIEALISVLLKKYPTINKISGHYMYANKACPSYDVKEHQHLLKK